MRWSLNELYTSFDSEEFKGDMEKFEQFIKDINGWVEENLGDTVNPAEKLEQYIEMLSSFYSLYSRLGSYCSLTASVEARNEKALQFADKIQKKVTELTKADVAFQKWLGNLENLEEVIQSSPILTNHKFFINEIAAKNQYLLSDQEEMLLAKMATTGSKAWSKLQALLSSTLLVDIEVNGEQKQLPLPVVRNMAYDKNPEVRKTAFEAELKSYKKIEESTAACLNGIKGEAITVAKTRGYNSNLEQTLNNSRMKKETLDAMLTAMKESLPAFHKFYRKKAELLGHTNGIPFYDIFAPIGSAEMTFSYEDAQTYIVKNFRNFSDKLADFTQNAFDKNWLDVEPREGKRGGAFCSNLHSIKESRILSNYNGSFSNLTTLAHELGHAYHGYCLKDQTILNSRYTMPVAETASIFAETIIVNAALKEATKEEAFSILESSISDAGQVIVDIFSRYLFESELFARREDHSLSVNELKTIMMDAQKQAYGDGLDHNTLHPYMWVNKPHYYYAELNFYNFPYAFGLLFSKGIYSEYLKRGEAFVGEYDRLLEATGQNCVEDVAKMAGIDVTDVEFWRSSLRLIEADIEKFIEVADAIK
jgi:pepF/M3 family oligoendopeptidase